MSLQMNSKSVLNYARSKITHLLDSSSFFAEEKGLRDSCALPHKGCYLGIIDPANQDVLREGFMIPSADNVLSSIDKCIENLIPRLKSTNFLLPQFTVAQLFVTVVEDCQYMADPLTWDPNTDGVYFQWGDRYRGFYLPYQISRMNLTKTAILDRLVGWETGLACNLWRTECGLCFRLKCLTIS